MSPDFDRLAAHELQQIDLINKNEHLSKTFKPFNLGLLFFILGCLFGIATYFMLPSVSSSKLIFGILLSIALLLVFAKYYLKILWRMKSKTMRKEDFDLLMKWSLLEAKYQKRIVNGICVFFVMFIVFLGSSFTLTFIALLLAFLGLFFLLFSAVFFARR